ncbi:MAG: cytochrome c oxidase subunit II [Gammaproteobacteria bacterium]|nr:cytochrome c oxidase subunit II [Gammaproteobacteria bacterium]
MQEIAWIISLVLMLAVVGVFIFVVINSGREMEYEPVQKRFYFVRTVLFWIFLIGIIGVTWDSLKGLPYAAQKAESQSGKAQIVDAEGYQWYWKLSTHNVKVNQPVIFNVSSADVNHGFGIYDESLTLLAQTQAMPGYINKLEYTFTTPGSYQILCMEYCGVAHHAMMSMIQVEAE